MEKTDEFHIGMDYQKMYYDEDYTLFNLMDDIENNEELVGWYVSVTEGVESDMQSIDGDYSFERLRNEYKLLQIMYDDLQFTVCGSHNGFFTYIIVDSKDHTFMLNSPEPDLEITDLI